MGGHTTHTLRSIRKWGLLFALAGILTSCFGEIRTAVLSEPDVYSRIYEAKETVILRAIARVFKEKKIGTKVSIDYTDKTVNSDYLESDSWRTKACARISKLNWKECEVMLAITTEKKVTNGWEKRRLLQKEQYDTFFDVIELKIYEEMARGE